MSDFHQRQIDACNRMLVPVRALLTELGLNLQPCGPLLYVKDALETCIAQCQEAIEVARGPECVAAEEAIIGALLNDNACYKEIVDNIDENDFVLKSHRTIWLHITTLIRGGWTADIVTTWESICRLNECDQVIGLQYLGELAANCPSSAGIASWARIVREKAEQRRKAA